MLFSTIFALSVAAGASAVVTASSPAPGLPHQFSKNATAANAVAGAYIVKLKRDSSLSVRSPGSALPHEEFHKRAAGIDYSVRRQFTNPKLFYGISLDVKQDAQGAGIQAKLQAIEGVEAVFPVVEVSRLGAEKIQKRTCRPRPTSTSASSATSTASSTSSVTLPKITGTSDVLSALKMTGIDKLHDMGIKGKGMKIGIIDTGVDYRHPSLGGGFGPGFKVAGGYAFRDDDFNSVSSPDPLCTCVEGGHGTHVSGIIGMEDGDSYGFGLVGVAPEAEIYMYRVFGCLGGAQTDDILAALEKAYEDGVDVVSMSLGLTDPWNFDDPFIDTTTALHDAGIPVVAAAGNDGTSGLFQTSAPGVGAGVISVGCVENTQFPVVYRATDSLGAGFRYASVFPLSSGDSGYDVYVLEGDGSGCTEADWATAAQTVTDLSKTIIMFYNSPSDACVITDKLLLWQQYGVSLVMDYTYQNTNPYSNQYVLLEQEDNTTMYTNVLAADGLNLVASYNKAGGYSKYKMMFTNNTVESADMATGGMISYFSSFGPAWDTLEVKPQLSAPGASILATWPLGFNSGYAAIRGTSMATPLVAASYALLKSQLPGKTIQQIRELLQSTAAPVSSAYYPSNLASATQQGAGLVNVYQALISATTVSPTEFTIGDSDDFTGASFNFTITNESPQETQTYEVSHDTAPMMYFLPFGVHPYQADEAAWDAQPDFDIYVTLAFSETSVTLAPGESAVIEFTVSGPDASQFDERNIPVVSGFIRVKSAAETRTIPYQGLPYSRWSAQYLDLRSYTVSSDPDYVVPWPTIYMKDPRFGNVTVYNGTGGIIQIDKKPVIIWEWEVGPLLYCIQPSQYIRADLLPANTTFVPTHYGYDTTQQFDYILTRESYRNTLVDGVTPTFGEVGGVFAWEPTYGVFEMPDMDVESPNDEWEDEGGWAPTSVGDYRILLGALRWGGNKTDLTHWETWLSPVMRVVDSGLPNLGIPT